MKISTSPAFLDRKLCQLWAENSEKYQISTIHHVPCIHPHIMNKSQFNKEKCGKNSRYLLCIITAYCSGSIEFKLHDDHDGEWKIFERFAKCIAQFCDEHRLISLSLCLEISSNDDDQCSSLLYWNSNEHKYLRCARISAVRHKHTTHAINETHNDVALMVYIVEMRAFWVLYNVQGFRVGYVEQEKSILFIAWQWTTVTWGKIKCMQWWINDEQIRDEFVTREKSISTESKLF